MKHSDKKARILAHYYDRLYKSFGPQRWWPGETRYEVITGAILTQNTAWSNVEKAVANLKKERLLNARAMFDVAQNRLASLIRPAGYFNVKAARLKNFAAFLMTRHDGSLNRLFKTEQGALRKELLAVNGIGPETADSIILYAGGLPEFVVDAYTKRIFSRHNLTAKDAAYDELKALFTENLKIDVTLFNEYHALIVKTGKDFCKNRNPLCAECPLFEFLDVNKHSALITTKAR